MPERPNGAVSKTVILYGIGGSNPPPTANAKRCDWDAERPATNFRFTAIYSSL